MRTVNMHEAKTHLSRLVKAAAEGEPFVIARAGKPVVKVTAVDAPDAGSGRRLGFLTGQIQVPDDFDRMGAEAIQAIFEGGEWSSSSIPTCCSGPQARRSGCRREHAS